MSKKKLISIADHSLLEPSEDLLGHIHLAEILQQYIQTDIAGVRTIGVIGSWGSGKSSVKNLTNASLRHLPKTKTVEFNAWRHGGGDVERAFFRELYLSLGGEQEELDRSLFSSVDATRTNANTTFGTLWNALGAPSLKLLGIWTILVAVATLLASIPLYFLQDHFESSPIIIAGMVVLPLLWPVCLAFYKFILAPRWMAPLLQETVTVRQGPVSASEQYEVLLLKQLENTQKDIDHLIVFVDDIDRLRPQGAIAAIEALRTFLDMPKQRLTNIPNLTFVISIDEVRLGSTLQSELIGLNEARDYVTRLFHLRVEIPAAPTKDLRSYALTLLARDSELLSELQEKSVTNAVLDRLVTDDVGTPREVVRLINRFIQMAWLAHKRESDNLELAGLISPGRITQNYECLAASVALSERFPVFTRSIIQDPRQLSSVSKYAVDRSTKVPESFKDKIDENPDLRRYLASLYGLRWPDNESTFFCLAEDAFSREFGETANNVRKALVSNDVDGARNSLDLNGPADVLTHQPQQIFYDVLRQLPASEGVRAENAARTTLLLLHQVDVTLRAEFCQLILPTWNASPRLRHSINIKKPLSSFIEVSQQLAGQLLFPLFEDMLSDKGISSERPIDEIRRDIAYALKTGLTISNTAELLKPLISRFLRKPAFTISENPFEFPWTEVLSWFPDNSTILDSYRSEFFVVFGEVGQEKNLTIEHWHHLSTIFDSLANPPENTISNLLLHADAEDLRELINKGAKWHPFIRRIIVMQAEELALEGALKEGTIRTLNNNVEILSGCDIPSTPTLLAMLAENSELSPNLFLTLARQSLAFPTRALLEKLNFIRPEAIIELIPRVDEEIWKQTKDKVIKQFIAKGSSDNHVLFLEKLPDDSPVFSEAGLDDYFKHVSTNYKNDLWLKDNENLIRIALKRSNSKLARNYIFNSINTTASSNLLVQTSYLIGSAVGITKLDNREITFIENAANRTPCASLVDFSLAIPKNERPENAINWLNKSWSKSDNFEAHKTNAEQCAKRMSHQELSTVIKNHHNNPKTIQVFNHYLVMDLLKALSLLESIPNNTARVPFAQALWKTAPTDELLEHLTATDVSLIIESMMQAWSGFYGSLSQITNIAATYKESAINIILNRLDHEHYKNSSRVEKDSFVSTLATYVPTNSTLKKIANYWDVRAALQNVDSD